MSEIRLDELLDQKVEELRETVGRRYASVMEGYGNMVAILNMVEGYYKECKKEIHRFVPHVSEQTAEPTIAHLNTLRACALTLSNASLALAANMQVLRDTVTDITGGDLLDMLEDEDGR